MQLHVDLWEGDRLDAAPAASSPGLREALTALGFRRTGVVAWSSTGLGRAELDSAGGPVTEETWLQPGGTTFATLVANDALGLLTSLDDGTLIYSQPAAGPLSDGAYVMPGTLRAELPDLQAIRESLTPGLPVYFH